MEEGKWLIEPLRTQVLFIHVLFWDAFGPLYYIYQEPLRNEDVVTRLTTKQIFALVI